MQTLTETEDHDYTYRLWWTSLGGRIQEECLQMMINKSDPKNYGKMWRLFGIWKRFGLSPKQCKYVYCWWKNKEK